MSTAARRPSSREKLLSAAADLVAEHGVQHLTIEATAAAAGVTKAGLIYHFKTRDDLLSALVEHMVGELDFQTRGGSVVDGEVSLKSLVDGLEQFTFDMPPAQKRLLTNMLAAATTHPHLLPPVRSLFEKSYSSLDRGPMAGRALLLSAALDGLLLLELLQLHTFSPNQRDSMRSAFRDLSRDLP
ncbi:TetR/AcrR family transcriptional regulator [Paracidovorax konjaci]|uniref:TetR/AcrR family transcriptional regulator n=1 Tax=Paracidovorax konjaci TaxID=32040 RepID=UPI000AB14FA8|nr:TetR/AcrR family transcriptional regulator [Paracidovorax konjaci]